MVRVVTLSRVIFVFFYGLLMSPVDAVSKLAMKDAQYCLKNSRLQGELETMISILRLQ
jgi:hypothetical protein